MKLENQVVSLDLAKLLKELGVKQDGLFTWIKAVYVADLREEWELWSPWEIAEEGEDFGSMEEQMDYASAFTVAELGEMLPWEVQDEKYKKYTYWSSRVNQGNEWGCAYEGFEQNLGGYVFVADTEADARAKMLIYLLENKLV